jgi:hypothetical protein
MSGGSNLSLTTSTMMSQHSHDDPDAYGPQTDEERKEEAVRQAQDRRPCPACHGTTLNLTHPNDGGSCPHCFGGFLH